VTPFEAIFANWVGIPVAAVCVGVACYELAKWGAMKWRNRNPWRRSWLVAQSRPYDQEREEAA
jgi:hypothetical protein